MTETRQFYDFQTSVAPAELPLTLEEVEAHLRIPADSEDTYITFLINTVRYFFENYTNRTLINTTYKGFLDAFSGEYYDCDCDESGTLIRKSKVSSITSIKYYTDDVLTVWADTNYYLTDSNTYPKVLLTEDGAYPTSTDDIEQAIEIIFVAGYGATNANIPIDIKMALLNHIAFLYENRGDCGGDGTCQLPCASKTIYDQYRIRPMGWRC
jgi:uncharacterized phiE125 gp8 family phage protein